MAAHSLPQIELIKDQFPQDHTVLGLHSSDQLEAIKLILERFCEYLERDKVLLKGTYLIDGKKVALPLKIRKLDNQQIILMLDPKVVGIVGTGRDFVVRKIYNLSKGIFQAKTPCFTALHKSIYEQLSCKKGIISVKGFYENCWNETQVIEPLYQTDLFDYYQNKSLSTVQKIQLFTQLLEGLVAIHNTKHSYTYQNETFTGLLCHGDIKLENILINLIKDGQLQTVITDFDMTGDWARLSHTENYESPELALLCKEFDSESRKPAIIFNKNFGQAKDLWCLGIVFSMVLGSDFADEEDSHRVYYLPFLKEVISANTVYERIKILRSLSQSRINSEIEEIQKLTLQHYSPEEGEKLNSLWLLVNQMLTVNPFGRITAREALEYINNLKI